jgi:hypothetical protein
VFVIGVVVQITAISGGHNEILAGRFITLVLIVSFAVVERLEHR